MSKKIVNNAVVLKPSKITGKQKFLMSKMDQEDRVRYIMSKVGIRNDSRYEVRALRHKHLIQRDLHAKPLVHELPNHFLNLLQRQFELGNKKPISKDLYYGIEIECLIPFKSLGCSKYDFEGSGERDCYECEGSGTVTFRHRDSGGEIEGECPVCEGSGTIDDDEGGGYDSDSAIDHACAFLTKKAKELKIKGMNAVHDGSIDDENDNYMPIEITLLVKRNDLSDLQKTCDLLNSLGAIVNASCGLHVHLDARNKSEAQVKRIGERFANSLKFLGAMVPESRRHNRYCRMEVSSMTGERYHAVNLTAFKKHSTIEIRLHSATTSFEKISNWLKVITAVAETTSTSPVRSWKMFFELIKADTVLKQYIKNRVEKFKGQIEEDEMSDEPCSDWFEQTA